MADPMTLSPNPTITVQSQQSLPSRLDQGQLSLPVRAQDVADPGQAAAGPYHMRIPSYQSQFGASNSSTGMGVTADPPKLALGAGFHGYPPSPTGTYASGAFAVSLASPTSNAKGGFGVSDIHPSQQQHQQHQQQQEQPQAPYLSQPQSLFPPSASQSVQQQQSALPPQQQQQPQGGKSIPDSAMTKTSPSAAADAKPVNIATSPKRFADHLAALRLEESLVETGHSQDELDSNASDELSPIIQSASARGATPTMMPPARTATDGLGAHASPTTLPPNSQALGSPPLPAEKGSLRRPPSVPTGAQSPAPAATQTPPPSQPVSMQAAAQSQPQSQAQDQSPQSQTPAQARKARRATGAIFATGNRNGFSNIKIPLSGVSSKDPTPHGPGSATTGANDRANDKGPTSTHGTNPLPDNASTTNSNTVSHAPNVPASLISTPSAHTTPARRRPSVSAPSSVQVAATTASTTTPQPSGRRGSISRPSLFTKPALSPSMAIPLSPSVGGPHGIAAATRAQTSAQATTKTQVDTRTPASAPSHAPVVSTVGTSSEQPDQVPKPQTGSSSAENLQAPTSQSSSDLGPTVVPETQQQPSESQTKPRVSVSGDGTSATGEGAGPSRSSPLTVVSQQPSYTQEEKDRLRAYRNEAIRALLSGEGRTSDGLGVDIAALESKVREQVKAEYAEKLREKDELIQALKTQLEEKDETIKVHKMEYDTLYIESRRDQDRIALTTAQLRELRQSKRKATDLKEGYKVLLRRLLVKSFLRIIRLRRRVARIVSAASMLFDAILEITPEMQPILNARTASTFTWLEQRRQSLQELQTSRSSEAILDILESTTEAIGSAALALSQQLLRHRANSEGHCHRVMELLTTCDRLREELETERNRAKSNEKANATLSAEVDLLRSRLRRALTLAEPQTCRPASRYMLTGGRSAPAWQPIPLAPPQNDPPAHPGLYHPMATTQSFQHSQQYAATAELASQDQPLLPPSVQYHAPDHQVYSDSITSRGSYSGAELEDSHPPEVYYSYDPNNHNNNNNHSNNNANNHGQGFASEEYPEQDHEQLQLQSQQQEYGSPSGQAFATMNTSHFQSPHQQYRSQAPAAYQRVSTSITNGPPTMSASSRRRVSSSSKSIEAQLDSKTVAIRHATRFKPARPLSATVFVSPRKLASLQASAPGQPLEQLPQSAERQQLISTSELRSRRAYLDSSPSLQREQPPEQTYPPTSSGVVLVIPPKLPTTGQLLLPTLTSSRPPAPGEPYHSDGTPPMMSTPSDSAPVRPTALPPRYDTVSLSNVHPQRVSQPSGAPTQN